MSTESSRILTHEEQQTRIKRAEKAILTLRYRLLGAAHENPDWLLALDALEFSREAHQGMTRDDQITPYIFHPVEAALYVLTLHASLAQPVQTVAATLLHDVLEDCDVKHAQLQERFGKDVAQAVLRVSKPRLTEGRTLDLAQHFSWMALCPIASIVKGADRVNNQGTLGEQNPGRQMRKVDETETYVLPMLKEARRRFPRQELAYENIKLMLRNQIALVRAVHAGTRTPAASNAPLQT